MSHGDSGKTQLNHYTLSPRTNPYLAQDLNTASGEPSTSRLTAWAQWSILLNIHDWGMPLIGLVGFCLYFCDF